MIFLSILLNFHFPANCTFKLTSSPARWSCGFLFTPSFLLRMYLSTCKTVLCISFLSILIISCNLQDGTLCFFSLHIFFSRCRWQDGRFHLTDMLLLYLPWKDHLLVVLHRAFCGFNHDTSGWFSIYSYGGKRCTDVENRLF